MVPVRQGDKAKFLYLKGYEEGLRDAWGEVMKMVSKGYTAKEIKLYLRSNTAAMGQTLEQKARKLDDIISDMDIDLGDSDDHASPPQYASPPSHDLYNRGAPQDRYNNRNAPYDQYASRNAPYDQYNNMNAMNDRPRTPEDMETDVSMLAERRSVPPDMGSREVKAIPGYSYLFVEDKPVNSFRMYERLLGKGWNGLCITRTNPSQARDIYGVSGGAMTWLTKRLGSLSSFPSSIGVGNLEEDYEKASPSDLAGLASTMLEFMKSTAVNRVIMFDGIEYLITQNQGFDPIARLLQNMNETAAVTGTVLIVPAGTTLKAEWLSLLKKEFSLVL